MKRFLMLAVLAMLSFPAYAAQKTITTEGAFDYTIRDQVNDNFDELYGMAHATIWICGDATTVNNNTVYYGPLQTTVDGSGRTCDKTAAGNVTEATADVPAFPLAFKVTGFYCLQPDAGANLTYTLRSAAAATTPSLSFTVADNALHGATSTPTTTDIAAGATLAIAVSSSSDVGTAQFACALSIVY